jgi:hypothetical protein
MLSERSELAMAATPLTPLPAPLSTDPDRSGFSFVSLPEHLHVCPHPYSSRIRPTLAVFPGLHSSTFLPPFPRHGFALHASCKISFLSETSSCRYYEGSDSPNRSLRLWVSPLTATHLPDVPSPTTWCALSSLCQSLQRDRFVPGFAMNEQARRSTPPKRVRYPTDRQFASGCSPPRLTATQLPSATRLVTYPGTDFHRADVRHRGRTHSREGGNPVPGVPPRKRSSRVAYGYLAFAKERPRLDPRLREDDVSEV